MTIGEFLEEVTFAEYTDDVDNELWPALPPPSAPPAGRPEQLQRKRRRGRRSRVIPATDEGITATAAATRTAAAAAAAETQIDDAKADTLTDGEVQRGMLPPTPSPYPSDGRTSWTPRSRRPPSWKRRLQA